MSTTIILFQNAIIAFLISYIFEKNKALVPLLSGTTIIFTILSLLTIGILL